MKKIIVMVVVIAAGLAGAGEVHRPREVTAQGRSADAAVKVARAVLKQKKASLAQPPADWTRAESLYKSKGIAQADHDQYRAQFNVATANAEAAEAQIGVAEANLKTAQTNL